MPEFSIIVPIYKVEKYLPRCVMSILSQTFENFELILVDDGSPDTCGRLCDEFAQKDSRIKTIHKENGGVSSARNCGLKRANGNYICFVDADDIMAKNALYLIKKSIDHFNPDMIMFDYTVINDKTITVSDGATESVIINRNQAFDLCADFNKSVRMGIWNKVYRRACIENISFDEKKIMAEDIEFLMKTLVRCEAITYIRTGLYGYYMQRENSAMFAKHSLEWYEMQFKNVKESMQIVIDADNLLVTAASAYACVNGGLSCANGMAICNTYDKRIAKDVRKYIKNHLKEVLFSKLSFGKKSQVVLFWLSPYGYYKLMKKRFRR